MRKIDKSYILATAYQAWIQKYDNKNKPHLVYSPSHPHYKAVLVSLLHCQKGLCAYTEILIATEDRCDQNKFDARGKYIPGNKTVSGFAAQLDHFDSRLKAEKGWSWDNFFAVSDKINVQKKDTAVDDILKPDTAAFDPYKLLAYDPDKHLFYASLYIEDEQIVERIENMIDVLGINYGTIVDNRNRYLSCIFNRLKLGVEASDLEQDLYQFFTAYEMGKASLLNTN